VKTETLVVPGATLYYEVRGTGPVLLLICGGIYDAEAFAGLADALADVHTVVTYDRRGNSRSPLAGPPVEQRVEEHADDAYRLLAAVGVTESDPADVFGNSSGATFALELAARHSALLRTVVAHEPPVFELLPDAAHWRTVMHEVTDTFRQAGWGAAMGVFGAALGMGPEPAEGAPPSPAFAARMQRNMEFFVGYEVLPVGLYTPDLDALRAGPARIVAAAGAASAGEPPHRAALELASRLGGPPAALFPGAHGGFADTTPFAASLRAALG